MKAEIITIGDEILIGQIIDTNSAWIAEQLSLIGLQVGQITSISDNEDAITQAMHAASIRNRLILVTGGLGPTNDDITKHTLAKYFNQPLVFNEEVYKDVKNYFQMIGKEMLEVNKQQAEVPNGCTIFRNKNGTAPGMWFEKNQTVVISMPGVPYEMKAMMQEEIIPKLKEHFGAQPIVYRTVMTQGLGESFIADRIAGWEEELCKEGLTLAYLPSPGMVRLRIGVSLQITEQAEELINSKITRLQQLIPDYIFGFDNEQLEEVIGKLLVQQGRTLSTAESCTGGYLAHLITSVPGSSGYFMGAVISYSNEIKTEQLGVSQDDLDTHGVVSKQVVEQMANGARERLSTDYALSTSGIAGPGGGSKEKPVGTVWIALATPNKVISDCFHFGKNRERNIRKTALAALNMLRKELTIP